MHDGRAHDHSHGDSHGGHAHGGHAHGGHAHAHDVGHIGPQRYSIALGINLAFVAIEAIAGFWANSTALLSDAAHNLSDVLGLAIAGGAAWLATKKPNAQRTYGFGKASVLAALANALTLVIASGAIGWEATRRMFDPQSIEPGIVMAVAAAGVVVNGASALLFMGTKDLNAKAAFAHLAADAAVSLGVIVAGFLVWRTGAAWIDPATSLVIVAVIVWGTAGLLKQSFDLAMDAAPAGVDVNDVRAHLAALEGVHSVHDLHVWPMSTTETALTAHLVRPAGGDDAFLADVARGVAQRFGIGHVTLQIERARRDDCADHH
ncbi:MAG: cation transporter [Hyphomonadaceae bacterium]|nr:cation transporter [Hyphomonadaceae bacterium]